MKKTSYHFLVVKWTGLLNRSQQNYYKVTLEEWVFVESTFNIHYYCTQKHTPPHCFFCDFSGWDCSIIIRKLPAIFFTAISVVVTCKFDLAFNPGMANGKTDPSFIQFEEEIFKQVSSMHPYLSVIIYEFYLSTNQTVINESPLFVAKHLQLCAHVSKKSLFWKKDETSCKIVH